VSDSILVSLAKGIYAAIEARRRLLGFVINDFETDWEFGGRGEEELTEGPVYVRVVVPPTYVYATLNDRDGSWEHGAQLAIEVRSKLARIWQEPDGAELAKERISVLARLTEQLHEFFPGQLTDRRIWLSDHDRWAEWVDERGQLRSSISTVATVERLQNHRMFLGVLLEAFEITEGTEDEDDD
jgi:hypothetical protein